MPHTSHTGTPTHWEGLTFLTYLLPLAWQSSGNSKQASGSHPAAVPLSVLQLMGSQFFFLWPHLLKRCSLVKIVPHEHRTSNVQLSGGPNLLAVTSLQWGVSGKAGYCLCRG